MGDTCLKSSAAVGRTCTSKAALYPHWPNWCRGDAWRSQLTLAANPGSWLGPRRPVLGQEQTACETVPWGSRVKRLRVPPTAGPMGPLPPFLGHRSIAFLSTTVSPPVPVSPPGPGRPKSDSVLPLPSGLLLGHQPRLEPCSKAQGSQGSSVCAGSRPQSWVPCPPTYLLLGPAELLLHLLGEEARSTTRLALGHPASVRASALWFSWRGREEVRLPGMPRCPAPPTELPCLPDSAIGPSRPTRVHRGPARPNQAGVLQAPGHEAKGLPSGSAASRATFRAF